jgi:hypothetical protein
MGACSGFALEAGFMEQDSGEGPAEKDRQGAWIVGSKKIICRQFVNV